MGVTIELPSSHSGFKEELPPVGGSSSRFLMGGCRFMRGHGPQCHVDALMPTRRRAKKKPPDLAESQGGLGHLDVPGAIGR